MTDGESLRGGTFESYPFRDPQLPEEDRITHLLGLMTLAEKIHCLGTNPSVPRLGVVGSGHVEGLHGLALGGPGRWGKDRPVPTTTFPQAIGMAETWDPELVFAMAELEGYEARYVWQSPRYQRGGLVVRAPNADLGRDPRWGRTEECYGEDALLTSTMAVAFASGLQGEHPRYWRAASLLKHFLANSNEDTRETSTSDFDERLFHEYYSVPFRRAIVEGGARAFMAAYNAHNGVPCTVHPMLRQIAREVWGHDGIICTDGGAFRLLQSAHLYFEDRAQAVKAVLDAGVNQFLDRFNEAVAEALERGLLSEQDVEAAIRPNFRVMIRLGLLDPPELVPYSRIGLDDEDEPWLRPEHQAAVLHATRKSIVLLKNEAGFLPLDPEAPSTLAVVGPSADRVLLDWYSGTPPYTVSPVEGIRRRVGPGVEVLCSSNNDDSEAVALARRADRVVVCVGSHPTGDRGWGQVARPSWGKEAADRQSLVLEDEHELIERVYAANPRTVLVLISSFPYSIVWSQQHLPAILHMTHGSQELGAALAAVLFGDENPAGRLVQTWPSDARHLPPLLDYDLRHGRTYQYSRHAPLYPFGHGLSYTSFNYGPLAVAFRAGSGAGSIVVELEVRNVGDRPGDEVVQVYASYPRSRVARPRRQLVAFARVTLAQGEARSVKLSFDAELLAYWGSEAGQFVVEPGPIELSAGPSSAVSLSSATLELAVERCVEA